MKKKNNLAGSKRFFFEEAERILEVPSVLFFEEIEKILRASKILLSEELEKILRVPSVQF